MYNSDLYNAIKEHYERNEINIFISHSWRYKKEYEKIKRWIDEEYSIKWKNYSIPHDKPVGASSTRELAKNITNKINLTHCVIIASGMYVSHSEWIDYEINEALRLGKSIIAIKPWGNERVPSIISNNTEIIQVNWNRSSLITEIKKSAK